MRENGSAQNLEETKHARSESPLGAGSLLPSCAVAAAVRRLRRARCRSESIQRLLLPP